MPAYDYVCNSGCGRFETIRPISQAREPFACQACGGPGTQLFLPEHAHHARIEDMENVGSDRRDSTRGLNLGLGGTFVDVGRRPDGTRAVEYRPTTAAEASSVRAARDIAKSQNLTMDGARYRTTK